MRKKVFAALLAVCMVVSMIPMMASAEGETLAIAGYGFLWNDYDEMEPAPELAAGGTTSNDWMAKTAYVVFETAPAAEQYLWFELTTKASGAGETTRWGCIGQGNGTAKTFAFSFLNDVGQWEVGPQAKEIATGTEVTLTVYATDSEPQAGDKAYPENYPVDEATYTKIGETITFTASEDADVKEEIKAEETVAPTIKVTAAEQADTSDEPQTELSKNYTATEGAEADGTTPVTVKATDIKEHKNGQGNLGYWIGATFTPVNAAEDATEYVILYKNGETWAIDTDSCSDASIVSQYINAFNAEGVNTEAKTITVGVFSKADAISEGKVVDGLKDEVADLIKTYTVVADAECTKFVPEQPAPAPSVDADAEINAEPNDEGVVAPTEEETKTAVDAAVTEAIAAAKKEAEDNGEEFNEAEVVVNVTVAVNETATTANVPLALGDKADQVGSFAVAIGNNKVTLPKEALELEGAAALVVTNNGTTTDADKTVLQSYTVTLKKDDGSEVVVADLEEPIQLTFDIGTDKEGTLKLAYVKDGKVLADGIESAYDKVTGKITGTITHLTEIVVVDENDIDEVPAPSTVTAVWAVDETETNMAGGKLTLSGLTAGNYYLIQVSKGADNKLVFVEQAEGETLEINIQGDTTLEVWEKATAPTRTEPGTKVINGQALTVPATPAE